MADFGPATLPDFLQSGGGGKPYFEVSGIVSILGGSIDSLECYALILSIVWVRFNDK